MPNYSLVVDAAFQPFTYQELAAPLIRATEKHEQLMDKYDELSMTSQQYGRYVGGEGSKSKAMYDTYMNDLLTARDTLDRYGLARNGRGMLSNVRNSYARNMMPLQESFATRKAEAEAQQKGMLADPTIRYSRVASATDLDYYLDNPGGGYQTISGKMVQAQVAAAASVLSKRLTDPNSKESKMMQQIAPEYYKAVQYGISPEEIAGNWQNNPVLTALMQNVLGGYGINVDNNGNFSSSVYGNQVAQEIGSMAVSGLYAGVGQTQLVEDIAGRAELNHRYHEMEADTAMQRQMVLEDYKHENELAEIYARLGYGVDENGNLVPGAGGKGSASSGYMTDSGDGSYSNFHPVEMEGTPRNDKAIQEADKMLEKTKSPLTKAGLSVTSSNTIRSSGIDVDGTRVNLYDTNGNLKPRERFINEAGAASNDLVVDRPTREDVDKLLAAGILTTDQVRKFKWTKHYNGVETVPSIRIRLDSPGTTRNPVTQPDVERALGSSSIKIQNRERTAKRVIDRAGTAYDNAIKELRSVYGEAYHSLSDIGTVYRNTKQRRDASVEKAYARTHTYLDTGLTVDDLSLDVQRVYQVKQRTYDGYNKGDSMTVGDLKELGLKNTDVFLSYEGAIPGIVIRGMKDGKQAEYIIPYESFNDYQKALFNTRSSADAVSLMGSFAYNSKYAPLNYNQSLPEKSVE